MIVYVWDYVCMKGSWVAVVVGIKSDLSSCFMFVRWGVLFLDADIPNS